MSPLFSRNVVIPAWFAVFALVTIVAPPLHFFPSVFLLIVGLALPIVVYLLWQPPSVPVPVAPLSIDTTPNERWHIRAHDTSRD